MTSIFTGLNGSWGTLSTVNSGAYGAGQGTLTGAAGAMTIDKFVAASTDEQIKWLKDGLGVAVGGTATISGGYELTLEKTTETYQEAKAKKDTSGNYIYDNYGRALMEYTTKTRDVYSVAVKPADGGLIPTSGEDASTIPYHNLPGSASGTDGALNRATAGALFPALDGLNGTLSTADRPSGFDVKADELTTAAQISAFQRIFNTWHSSYQVEWVNANLTRLGIGNGVLKLPTTATNPTATYVASAPPPAGGSSSLGQYSPQPKIYQVDTLSKNDFATMPTQDQLRVSGTNAFLTMAASLGLSADKAPLLAAVTQLKNAVTGYTATNRNNEHLPADAQKAYTDQLDLLTAQLNKMSVFSPADISAQITELKTRFDRLAAFYNVNQGTFTPANEVAAGVQDSNGNWGPNTQPAGFYEKWAHVGDNDVMVKIPTNIVSLDNNASINQGYNVFLQQEMRMRDLKEARAAVAAGDGYMNGKKLDAPSMIYYFQNQYNLQKEAKVTAETEEVKQQNAYLKTIAAMQKLINETLAMFKKADEDGKKLLGKDVNWIRQANDSASPSADDLQTMKILAMFSNQIGSTQKHPLEVMRGLDRPKFDITRNEWGGSDSDPRGWDDKSWDLEERTHPQWSNYGTQLSELVTLVNQDSQLKMNDINSLDRERNRHYDLANSALQKMADMIQSISQAN